jgi:bacterioferritin
VLRAFVVKILDKTHHRVTENFTETQRKTSGNKLSLYESSKTTTLCYLVAAKPASKPIAEDNMPEQDFDKTAVVALLNEILETELAGVVRYTHYSLMIFGHNRIPIVSWLRGEATTCLAHANEAGEMVTHLGEHPSLKIGALLESEQHSVQDILLESLEAEKTGLALYKRLLDLSRDRSVFIEEYARKMIADEEMHLGEVNKMLRKPGEIHRFKPE